MTISGPALIELGEDWSAGGAPSPERARARSVRVLVAAALLVVVLLGLGGNEGSGRAWRRSAS